MDITFAGNTSLTSYCLEKLCRKGVKVSRLLVPAKGQATVADAVDFNNLAGEFDIELISIPNKDQSPIKTDLLINFEWPSKLPLPVDANLGVIGSNLAGQSDQGRLLDVAADIYSGKNKVEVQLLLENSPADSPNSSEIVYEPPFFKVLNYTEIELNHLDDLRSAKTKAAFCLYRMLESLLRSRSPESVLKKSLKREISFSKIDADRLVDWHNGAIYLHNLVRAYTRPNPGAYTWYDGYKLYIWRGHYFELKDRDFGNMEPGTIIDIEEELGILVKTGHGTFLITRLQQAGSPELPAWVWADKAHIVPGDSFQISEQEEVLVLTH
jgi:methionyl-tRNA formyltransferase